MKRLIIIAVVAMLVASVNGAYAMKDRGDRGGGHDDGLRGVGTVNSFDSERGGLGRGMVANNTGLNRGKGGHKRGMDFTEPPVGPVNDPVAPPLPDSGLSDITGSTNPPGGSYASLPTNNVPEPSALFLLLLGGIGLAGVRRRLKK